MTEEQKFLIDSIVSGTWRVRDGLVHVSGNIYARYVQPEALRGIQFGRVSGSANFRNAHLRNLDGMPKSIGGDFIVSHNRIQNLKNGPEEVGGEYNITGNPLDSLVGAPKSVGGPFYADELEVEDWSPAGWVEAWKTASPMGRNLLMDVMTPQTLNGLIQLNPKRMVEVLSPIWHDDDFDQIQMMLRFPPELGNIQDLMDLLRKARDLEGLL
jgi:hypothetical protein